MNTEDSVNAVQLATPIKVERNMQVLRSLQQREEQLVHELEAIHKSINIVLSILFPQETQNNKSDSDSEPDIAQENREHSLVGIANEVAQIESALQSPPKSKSLSNKSKFLNDEQRKKVIEYITDSKEQEAIKALPSHKRVSYIQKQLQEKYNINLSFYHASNIIKEYIVESK